MYLIWVWLVPICDVQNIIHPVGWNPGRSWKRYSVHKSTPVSCSSLLYDINQNHQPLTPDSIPSYIIPSNHQDIMFCSNQVYFPQKNKSTLVTHHKNPTCSCFTKKNASLCFGGGFFKASSVLQAGRSPCVDKRPRDASPAKEAAGRLWLEIWDIRFLGEKYLEKIDPFRERWWFISCSYR